MHDFPAHVLEFGVAVVRFRRDALVGVGDAGCFPVACGDAGTPFVVCAQHRRGVGPEYAQPVDQPRLGADRVAVAELSEAGVEPFSDFPGGGWGAVRGPLGPGRVLAVGGEVEAL